MFIPTSTPRTQAAIRAAHSARSGQFHAMVRRVFNPMR